MTAAVADRVELAYVAESVWGTTPTSPTLQNLRFTSESLHAETSAEDSKEIRPDRNVSDAIRLNQNASGDIGFEFSYSTYDELLKAALFASAWSSAVTDISSDTGIQAINASNEFRGDDGDFANYTAGEWVLVSGFTETANNGLFKIESVSSSDPGTADNDGIVVSGGTLTDEAAGDSVTITQGSSITNGTTAHSYSFQKKFSDISKYAVYTGMQVNSLSLTVAAAAIITGSFSLLGSNETRSDSAISGASNTTATTTPVMNAVDHVTSLLESQSSFEAMQVTIELNNNLRARNIIGLLGAESIGEGICNVTGSIQAYFEDNTLLTKFSDWTSTSIAFLIQDGDNNRYIIDMPTVKLTSGQTVAGGQSSDVMQELNYSAILDSTEQITLRIVRFPSS
jgi:hypothetical protein